MMRPSRPHWLAATSADSAAFNWRCTTKTVTQPGIPLPSAPALGAGADTRWEELYQRYRSLVRRAILRVCPRELGGSCDDIEQEAWVSVWNVLKSEREIAYPASYI